MFLDLCDGQRDLAQAQGQGSEGLQDLSVRQKTRGVCAVRANDVARAVLQSSCLQRPTPRSKAPTDCLSLDAPVLGKEGNSECPSGNNGRNSQQFGENGLVRVFR